jgi:hypothetical protein
LSTIKSQLASGSVIVPTPSAPTQQIVTTAAVVPTQQIITSAAVVTTQVTNSNSNNNGQGIFGIKLIFKK